MKTPPLVLPDPDAFVSGYTSVAAHRFDGVDTRPVFENVIEEAPVSLEWNGSRHIVMMATPTELEAFAIGFSVTEGIVDSIDQVLGLDVVPAAAGIGILMRIAEGCLERVAARARASAAGSSCGLCGIEDMQAATQVRKAVASGQRFVPQAIVRAMRELPRFQKIGAKTGAAHAAGFALPSGEILAVCEDAGRHNALDKLVGTLLLRGLSPADGFLALTCRASLEMVQKAAAAGFPMLCAISAPTGLATRMAQEAGVTLVAFAREEKFVCFSHPQRISVHPAD